MYAVVRNGEGLAYCDHATKTINLGKQFFALNNLEQKIVFYHELYHSIDAKIDMTEVDEVEADVYALRQLKEVGYPIEMTFKALTKLLGNHNETRLKKAKEILWQE
jgi:hypothetical protein